MCSAVRCTLLLRRHAYVHTVPGAMDLPPNQDTSDTRNDILTTLEQNEENFVTDFVSNLQNIFSCDKQSIVTHLEDKHTEESLFQLQSKLHELVQQTFPQYVGSKVIRRKRKELLARDAYVFGYSIVNRLEVAEMRSCLKTSSERSVLSQSTPDDDEAAAAVQQMAELLETCVALKSALDAAVTRIAALEKHHDVVSRELTSVKLKLQLAERVESETSVSIQVQPGSGLVISCDGRCWWY